MHSSLSSTCCFPLLHLVQLDELRPASYPRGHPVQDILSVELVKNPAGHPLQLEVVLLKKAYRPESHPSHDVEEKPDTKPRGHSLQRDRLLPAPKNPAGQDLQTVPLLVAVEAVKAGRYLPSSHSMHSEARVPLYLPASHAVQLGLPREPCANPAGQSSQLEELSCA